MIDFHVHQPAAAAYGPAEYLSAMDELGVDVSVVFTYEGLLRPSAAANDSLAAWVAPEASGSSPSPPSTRATRRRRGDRTVRPRARHARREAPPLAAGLLRPHSRAAGGVRGRGPARDPVLFHDGTPPFSTPLQLAVLARRHPETQIVLGHGGLHDLWREAIEAVLTTANVHLCMSGTPGYAMRAIVARCPLERLLFGTDAGLRPEPLQRYAVLRVRQLDELGLDDDQREAILVANPRRLLAT